MKATGPTLAILRFDTARMRELRGSQLDDLAYHFQRLLQGEETAADEWAHLGVTVECEEDTDQGDE